MTTLYIANAHAALADSVDGRTLCGCATVRVMTTDTKETDEPRPDGVDRLGPLGLQPISPAEAHATVKAEFENLSAERREALMSLNPLTTEQLEQAASQLLDLGKDPGLLGRLLDLAAKWEALGEGGRDKRSSALLGCAQDLRAAVGEQPRRDARTGEPETNGRDPIIVALGPKDSLVIDPTKRVRSTKIVGRTGDFWVSEVGTMWFDHGETTDPARRGTSAYDLSPAVVLRLREYFGVTP